ncbi:MAG: hypothetical protein R3229_09955 [Alphaproteobacteria bacterium]|nr:hypothetical protein [Alphaproteobacteria bacterium]
MSEQSVAVGGHNPAEGKAANLVYILYLVGLIVGITSLVGVVMAYVNRGDAPEWVRSHYRFQIRTFWIGLLYGVIGAVTTLILIGWVIILFVVIWWVIRCAKGMKAVGEGREMANAATWLW